MINVKFLLILFGHCISLIPRCSSDTVNINGNELYTLANFTVEIYEDSSLYEPRVMDHIVYNKNLIIYVGSKSTSTPIYALIDTNLDLINDYTINVFETFTGDNSELNGVSIDPITSYVYFTSQENLYICYNLHEYTLSLIDTSSGSSSVSITQNCTIFTQFPLNTVDLTHARHYTEFTPFTGDDLCIAFGADCDLCDTSEIPRTTILCYDMNYIRLNYNYNDLPLSYDNSLYTRTVAYGVRNSVGFDWHPISKNLYFTDNGANDIDQGTHLTFAPDDELNVIFSNNEGGHYGFPYVHTNGTGDPYLRDLGDIDSNGGISGGINTGGNTRAIYDDLYYDNIDSINKDNLTFILGLQALGPHAAALGMKFYNKDNIYLEQNIYNITNPDYNLTLFPDEFDNIIFIAEHGSWDHYGLVLGYRIMTIGINEDLIPIPNKIQVISHDEFITGWRDNGHDQSIHLGSSNYAWGRPAYVEILFDGTMLISDDYAHTIYRVKYYGNLDATYTQSSPTGSPVVPAPQGNIFVKNWSGINQWWYTLGLEDVVNTATVDNVYIRNSNNDWTIGSYEDWGDGAYVFNLNGWSLPFDVKIEAIDGEVLISNGVVTNLNEWELFDFGTNFDVCNVKI